MSFSRWVKFSFALTCVILLWIADTAITIYNLRTGFGGELNPLSFMGSETFFFLKGLGVSFIIILAYELRSRNPTLSLKGLYYCTAILTVVVIWNLANTALSYIAITQWGMHP